MSIVIRSNLLGIPCLWSSETGIAVPTALEAVSAENVVRMSLFGFSGPGWGRNTNFQLDLPLLCHAAQFRGYKNKNKNKTNTSQNKTNIKLRHQTRIKHALQKITTTPPSTTHALQKIMTTLPSSKHQSTRRFFNSPPGSLTNCVSLDLELDVVVRGFFWSILASSQPRDREPARTTW